MNEIWYVAAFVLMSIGASIGDRVDRSSAIDRPLNPKPLRVVSSVAGLAAIGFFIYGFFPFAWWLPFLALIAFASFGAFLIVFSMRSTHAPLISIISSAMGLILSALVLVSNS
jgi:hypothetical protein